MSKKIFTLCLASLVLASCTVKSDIEDNITHYEKLTRYSMIKQLDFSKHTNDIDGARFFSGKLSGSGYSS